MSQNISSHPALENMPEIQQRIKGLKASSVTCKIEQVPHAGNGNVALAQTAIEVGGTTISMPGIATPETSNTDKPHILLNDALMASTNSALRCLEGRPTSEASRRQENHPSTERRASPTKGISPKQSQFIARLGNETGCNPDDVAQKLVGKPLGRCSAADANTIIRHMKDEKIDSNTCPWH